VTAGAAATPPRLVATYFTLAGDVHPFAPDTRSPHSLEARARAAADAGFAGLGFALDDARALLERHGTAEIRAILAAHGQVDCELEVLMDWCADGERRDTAWRASREAWRFAEAFGAYRIKAVGDITGMTWPMEKVVADFARLCDDAAAHGCSLTVEILPTTNLDTLQVGRALVEGAGRRNGGLLLDSWHMVRGRVPMAAIAALPPGLVTHVEFDDGPLVAAADYIDETIEARCLPGDGEFPLVDFVRALDACGYRGAYGLELLSPTFRNLPPAEVARQAAEATRRVVAAARQNR
jgi:sugar phosphate isomerase/epimerase